MTSKRSSGGVIASRFGRRRRTRRPPRPGRRGAARGAGRACAWHSGVRRRMAPRMTGLRSPRMSQLGSAPVPPLRPDDHVRGRDSDPLLVVYGDFTCPRCALAWERPARPAVPRRVPPLRPAGQASAGRRARPGHGGGGPPGGLLADGGRPLDRPGPHRRSAPLAALRDAGPGPRPLRGRHRRDEATADRVRQDVRDGLRAGVAATPTLFRAGVATGHPGPPDAAFLASVAS